MLNHFNILKQKGWALKQQKYRIGMITSSSTVIDSIRRLNLDENIDLQWCLTKVMDEAIPFGKEMEQSGVEVIISRRGTAHTLRENLSIPVLSIPVTSLDILNCVKKAVQLGRRLLLPTFRNFLTDIEIIEELFDIEIIQQIYHDGRSLEEMVRFARDLDIEVVIGGGGSLGFAKKYGLRGCEIIISDEVVAAVLEDARSVAQSNRDELQKSMRYHYIVNSTSDAIISVDQNGNITTINQAAKGLFNIQSERVEGDSLHKHIPKSRILNVLKNGKAKINELEKVNGASFLANYIPIEMDSNIIGVVSTYRDASNVIKSEKKLRRLYAKGLVAKYGIHDFIYRSSRMDELIEKVKRFAVSDSTILITGETGTGKEIIAQSIHKLSPRNRGSFVSINCGALPDQLLESELFGHEEGAFTGSRRGGKAGLFELAHTGTIFLDEIAATSQSVQTRLLRVLQEKEVMRIGGEELFPVDVRVIAATNRELSKEVEKGHFREDLFFRLDVLKIAIPPLRDRLEDLPLLVQELIKRMAGRYNIPPITIPGPQMKVLMGYQWPGNVRQLENFIERLMLLSENETVSEIFNELLCDLMAYKGLPEIPVKPDDTVLDHYKHIDPDDNEVSVIRRALEEAKFCKTKAAKKLGISRTTLWRKIKEMEVT